MSFTINTLNFSNTGDVATDAAVDMSELDPKAVDAARITLDASDQETSGFASYEFTEEKFYFAASDSKSRRMLDLVSDTTNYVRAQASTVNFEESGTNFSDLFGTSVFEDRVLNDNSFLERVVHSENGFDEVFTNSTLYTGATDTLSRLSLFLSSYYVVDRGWSVDGGKIIDSIGISVTGDFNSGKRDGRFFVEQV